MQYFHRRVTLLKQTGHWATASLHIVSDQLSIIYSKVDKVDRESRETKDAEG